jgi:hypothetical protein
MFSVLLVFKVFWFAGQKTATDFQLSAVLPVPIGSVQKTLY